MLGNFMLLMSSADFFQNYLFQEILEYFQSVRQFGSRSVGPDLGPDCLQRVSADDKSCP